MYILDLYVELLCSYLFGVVDEVYVGWVGRENKNDDDVVTKTLRFSLQNTN